MTCRLVLDRDPDALDEHRLDDDRVGHVEADLGRTRRLGGRRRVHAAEAGAVLSDGLVDQRVGLLVEAVDRRVGGRQADLHVLELGGGGVQCRGPGEGELRVTDLRRSVDGTLQQVDGPERQTAVVGVHDALDAHGDSPPRVKTGRRGIA